MSIQLTVKKLELPEEVKNYAKEKFSRLDKFNTKIQGMELVLKSDDREIVCEAIIHLEYSGTIIVEVSGSTAQIAVDLAFKKCERQLRRDKEKVVSKVRKEANRAKDIQDN